MTLVRDATPDDIPLLAPIEARGDALFAEVGHPEFLGQSQIGDADAARAIAEGRIRVAELDGIVVGWLATARLDAELLLLQVCVEPAHARRGIGTALLLDCIERARAAGEASVILDTQADVVWNAPWYARHGFEPIPVDEWSDGLRVRAQAQAAAGLDWSARVFMRLRL